MVEKITTAKTAPRPMTLLRRIAYTGGLLSLCLVILALLVAFEILSVPGHKTDPGVALATTGLALFTGLLFFAGAVTAYFAYDEITTSTYQNKMSADANKASLALQMDNRFVSDRALRIRHGAVTFLAQHQRDANGEPVRSLDLHCLNPDSISPYSKDATNLWNELPSDLIDLFNYFDWIGYLAIEKPDTIDPEVVAQKFGPWIINYYQLCEDEIEHILRSYPARWQYLKPLYNELIKDEEKDWDKNKNNSSPPYRAKREKHELDAFILREHVRCHRGPEPW